MMIPAPPIPGDRLCYNEKSAMLSFDHDPYWEMIMHLTSVYPEEGCGFLAGIDGRITQGYPIENRLKSPTAFLMDPRQQVEALMAIEDAGQTLLAIYHSHPESDATLSSLDRRKITFPELDHVIVSLGQIINGVVVVGAVRGYRLTEDGAIVEVSIDTQ